MKASTIKLVIVAWMACIPSISALAQNSAVEVSVIPSYNRTSDFFVAVDVVLPGTCGWPIGNELTVMLVNNNLEVQVGPPIEPDTCNFNTTPVAARYFIPISRFLDTPTNWPDVLDISVHVVGFDGSVVAGNNRVIGRLRGSSWPLEAGQWQGDYGSVIVIDRVRGDINFTWTSDDLGDPEIGPVFDWPTPGLARSWIATGRLFGGYVRAPVTMLSPVLVSGASGVEIDRFPASSSSGELHAAMMSPIRILLSLPDGRQVEATRRLSGDFTPVRIYSTDTPRFKTVATFEGVWDWVGSRPGLISGKRLFVEEVSRDVDNSAAEWQFRFDGGSGKLRCTFIGCTIYGGVTSAPPGPIERFPLDGFGERRLFSQDAASSWHSIAYRADL